MYHDKKGIAPASQVIATLRTKSEGDPLDMLAQKIADMTDATLERIEAGEKKLADLDAVASDQERTLARLKGGGGGRLQQSWGEQFVTSNEAELKSLSESNSGGVKMNIKAVTGATGSGGAIPVPMRDSTAMLPQRTLYVRSLLNVIGTDAGTVEYAAQTARPARWLGNCGMRQAASLRIGSRHQTRS